MVADMYEGNVDVVAGGQIEGWVRRITSDEPVSVNAVAEGQVVGWCVADNFRPDLLAANKGSGRHGFKLRLPAEIDSSLVHLVADQSDFILPNSFTRPSAVAAPPARAALRGNIPPSDREGRLLIDLTDLIMHVRNHDSLSGIQRVQHEAIRHVSSLYPAREVVYCLAVQGGSHYLEVPHAYVAMLARDAGNLGSLTRARRQVFSDASWVSSLRRLDAGPNDVLIMLGAFWIFPGLASLLSTMKSLGTAIVVLIYDLLPIFEPQYFEKGLSDLFLDTFYRLSFVADRFLTISEFTATQVRQFYRETGRVSVPVDPVPLAHESVEQTPQQAVLKISDQIAELLREPYVLCVGTIEIRKNHMFLFRMWRDLIARHGTAAVPRLVLVGRRGWRVDDLYSQFDNTECLDGHIVLIEGLSDFELSELYEHCLFTVFPSFAEGWGLPVGESLAHGKVCLASNTGSIPEVGGDFVVYFDPYSLRDGCAAAEQLLFDRGRLGELEARLADFVPRPWRDVVTRLFACADMRPPAGAAREPAHPVLFMPPVPYATLIRMGTAHNIIADGPEIKRPMPFPIDLVLIDGWASPESDVVWARSAQPSLRFAVTEQFADKNDDQAQYRLYFLVKSRPAGGHRQITIKESANNYQSANTRYDTDTLIVMLAKGEAREGVRFFDIDFTSREYNAVPGTETSPDFGLKAFWVTADGDLDGRLTAMEDLLLYRS